MKKQAYAGASSPVQKNKQKHPVDLFIVWCVSITLGLLKHICGFNRKKNEIQTAVINIINLRILYNLTFRMPVNIHFQK